MRYLFDDLPKLEAAMAGRHLLVLLDFDGTLAPIARSPAEARLPDETRYVLERLSRDTACGVAVVSGRAIGDLVAKVGVPGITYVGNHGLEIARPGEPLRALAPARCGELMRRVASDLNKALARFPGAEVEDKGCGLAVHHRRVSKADRPAVRDVVGQVVLAHGGSREIETHGGKMVIELRPPVNWDKGTVVSLLMEAEELRARGRAVLTVFVGDDATDEQAFRVIAGRGFGVVVGRPADSSAEYFVNDPAEVRALLEALAGRPVERR